MISALRAAGWNLTWIGVLSAATFWIADSLVDVWVFGLQGPIALWPGEGRELYMRFAVSILLMLVGFVAESAARSHRRAEAGLRTAAGVFEATSDAIAIIDRKGRLLDGNRSFRDCLRVDETGLPAHFDMILDPGRSGITVPWDKMSSLGHWQGEIHAKRGEGQRFPAAVTITPLESDRSVFVVSLRDLSADRAIEARLRELARLDHLTGLSNRSEIRARLDRALNRAQRAEHRVVVFFVDLDHFKNLNDSLGHSVGDAYLQEIASRLLAAVRQSDAVGRVGGDEFVIVLEALETIESALQAAKKIRTELAEPVELVGRKLSCHCSIGAAIYPDDGRDVEALLRAADTAMYHAKQAGRDRLIFFRQEMNQRAERRLRLTNSLRESIASGDFQVHYQPILHLDTRKLWGVESLVRWDHPVLGTITATELIEIAEESGLIHRLGAAVLRRACLDFADWQEKGLSIEHIAVNVSPAQLRDERLVESLGDLLAETGLTGGQLELEVTESLITEVGSGLLERLDRLREHGVLLALDDFGTGYSSLTSVRALPVNRIKIDRSFVSAMATNPDDAKMVSGIVHLARSLGIETTGEGIETEAELKLLQELGCQLGQGFLFARAMSAKDIVHRYGD